MAVVLEESDLKAMIKRNSDHQAELNAALITSAALWGIKAMEGSKITVGDILKPTGQLKRFWLLRKEISHNGYQRELYTEHESLVKYLNSYLDWRTKNKIGCTNIGEYRGLDPDSRLFLNEKGKEFGFTRRAGKDDLLIPSGFNAYFGRLIKRSGVTGVSFRDFRSSLAIRMFRQGGGTTGVKKDIMQYLGIRSYDSLMKILSRDQKKITDAVKGLYKRL